MDWIGKKKNWLRLGEDIENEKGKQIKSRQLRRCGVIRRGGWGANWAGWGRSAASSGSRRESGQIWGHVGLRVFFLYKLDLESLSRIVRAPLEKNIYRKSKNPEFRICFSSLKRKLNQNCVILLFYNWQDWTVDLGDHSLREVDVVSY